MKLKSLLCLVLVLAILPLHSFAATAPTIEAGAYLVVDANTGKVLLEKNSKDKMFPASLTKMITALLAVEHFKPDDILTVTKEDIAGLYEEGSTVYLKEGESIVFSDLLKYLVVVSGNDATNLVARYISGGGDAFAKLMTQKAVELGCTGTNFANPHGLHDPDHYTTAYDMYLIGKAVRENPTLAEISGMASITLPATNMHPQGSTHYTTNHLISKWRDTRYLYPGVTGIKTGWTIPAGMCLVTSAEKNSLSIFTVVMNAPKRADTSQGSFTETTKLLDYVFNNFTHKTFIPSSQPIQEVKVLAAKKNQTLVLTLEKDFDDTLPKTAKSADLQLVPLINGDITAPIAKGDILGSVTISYDGISRGSVNLVASQDVEASQLALFGIGFKKLVSSKLFLLGLGVVLAIAIMLFVMRAVSLKNRRRRGRGRYGR